MTLKKLVTSALFAAALAGIGTGLTQWRAGAREAAAEAAYPPEGQFVTVEGLRIHAVVAGSGPDLVLIHGASGSARDFTFRMLPELSARYRVIAFDRPGHGWSDVAPEGDSIRVQARLLQRAAEELGADSPIVLGHSYGGAVALAWAVDHPDALAALVPVSAPSHPWDTPLPRFYQLTTPPLGRAILVPMIAAFAPQAYVNDTLTSVFAPQDVPRGYVDHFGPEMSLRRSALRANGDQRAALLEEITALAPLYPSISVPVESVHGTDDTTVGLTIHAQKLKRDVEGLNLTPLRGIGHMPQHVAIGDVIGAIDRARARARLR